MTATSPAVVGRGHHWNRNPKPKPVEPCSYEPKTLNWAYEAIAFTQNTVNKRIDSVTTWKSPKLECFDLSVAPTEPRPWWSLKRWMRPRKPVDTGYLK